MKFVCTRSGKPVDKRQHQRTLRTNLLNWEVDLVTRQTDWLRLVDESDEQVSELEDTERNARENADKDVEIRSEILTTEPRNETNTTPGPTPVTKPAISQCAKLTLPPSLLTDPAFLIAAR